MTRTFTGWHMAVITISFFAVIIAVNLTLAVFASTSWTGLVVANSYVERNAPFIDKIQKSKKPLKEYLRICARV